MLVCVDIAVDIFKQEVNLKIVIIPMNMMK